MNAEPPVVEERREATRLETIRDGSRDASGSAGRSSSTGTGARGSSQPVVEERREATRLETTHDGSRDTSGSAGRSSTTETGARGSSQPVVEERREATRLETTRDGSRDASGSAGRSSNTERSEYSSGSGEPVVLLHGIGSHWRMFAPILDRLAETNSVLALDLPGFGKRPLPPGFEPTPDGYAEWVAAELDARGIRDAHIVGCSMGGGVALEVGRRGFAAKVTAFSPVGFWSEGERRYAQSVLLASHRLARYAPWLVERLYRVDTVRAALLAMYFGRPADVDPDEARAETRALASGEAFDEARRNFARYRFDRDRAILHLADSEVDTIIAWGDRDRLLIAAPQSRRARLRLPHAGHVAIRGAGHVPFPDDAEACLAVIRRTEHPSLDWTSRTTTAPTRSTP